MISVPERLLALNIRASRIGYVLFDGPECLLDWGTRTVPREPRAGVSGRARIASLFTLTSPSAIVVYRAREKRDVDYRDVPRIVKCIRHEALLRSIPLAFVGLQSIQQLYAIYRVANKYEMAATAAGIYPELFWKLPPARKRWHTERRVMLVFDALNAGVAYWNQKGCVAPRSKEQRGPMMD